MTTERRREGKLMALHGIAAPEGENVAQLQAGGLPAARTYVRFMNLDLTDEEAAALLRELDRIVADDPRGRASV
jgi:hypothetical protein